MRENKRKLPLWVLAAIVWIPYRAVEWIIRKLRHNDGSVCE